VRRLKHSATQGGGAYNANMPRRGIAARILGAPLRRALFIVAAGCASFAPPASADFVEQHGLILIVPTDSALLLQVDPGFRPLWALQFDLGKLTHVDRRIFVDADDDFKVRRIVIVQFETVPPGADFKFVYPPKPPAEYGDTTYHFGAYVYDDAAAASRSPDKEGGITRAHLIAHGYKLPRLLRTARLARVSDHEGKSEIILFYMEAADADYPPGPLPGADADGDLSLDPAAQQQMLERLKAAIRPIAG
jgi:hypothetical protein